MAPAAYTDARLLAQEILSRTGKHVRLALPLGLGKAVTIANALTDLALEDPEVLLEIITALTLERPTPSGALQEKFLNPALDRLFGAYPGLRYARLLRERALPDNIRVHEFFLLAGRWLGNPDAQSNYITANYTHALDYLIDRRPNVVAQLLAAEGPDTFSLSCNTDITADLLACRRAGSQDFILAGETNAGLPFMPGPAEIAAEEVDLLLDDPDTQFELFSAVKRPVSLTEHAIGHHVARLVKDGGTIQIGIGTIGDAAAWGLLLRHRAPDVFGRIATASPFKVPQGLRESGPFDTGLYSVTEMLADGLLELFRAGIIRRVADGACIHAGFFVDSSAFYAKLHNLPRAEREKIAMMPVSYTNEIFGDEETKRAARRDARFINAAMKTTCLGGVVSDATSDGEIVSGVGGQYNFVAQAHALKNARSIITLPSTRTRKGKVMSNILWEHPHETIPRHLRDIVVTEYGVADLRGTSDEQAVLSMIGIADARFQRQLLEEAKSAGKISADATPTGRLGQNTPEAVESWLRPFSADRYLPDFPFGTDFNGVEQKLLPALDKLRAAQGAPIRLMQHMLRGVWIRKNETTRQCLARMGLERPRTAADTLLHFALLGALSD